MTLGLVPNSLWHLMAIFPPIILWWLARPWAKQQHISRWLSASLSVSYWEEFLFRGLLYGLVLDLVHNAPTAIISSSLLFGLFHLRNLWWTDRRRVVANCFYNGLIVGPLLGLVRFWTGDVYIGMLVHFLNNFINLKFAHNIPTDEYLKSKVSKQNQFERFFTGDWLRQRSSPTKSK